MAMLKFADKPLETGTAVARPAVPFMDLKAQFAGLKAEVLPALEQAAESAAFILGPRVAEFEAAFAEYVGARHCVAVNSGTSALHLALLAAGVGPGDEVITVPMTFIATSWAITYCGAVPVYVDVDPVTYTMDPVLVEARITPRTKAILPVHLYGQAADLGALSFIGGGTAYQSSKTPARLTEPPMTAARSVRLVRAGASASTLARTSGRSA